VAAPIAFANPAEVELGPAPIPAHWITEGAPQARSACLAESADGTCSVMAWSCTAGRFTWRYGGDEMLHVISGEAFVTDENGDVRRLGPGDMVFYPAGSLSSWYVPHFIRKVAVCRHSMPRPCGLLLRAWNRLIDIVTGFSTGELDRALLPKPAPKPDGAIAPHTGRAPAV
jgi:uncharacterized protein